MSDNGQEKQVLFEIKQLCKSFEPDEGAGSILMRRSARVR